jgi:outer membrane lipopolysaccharide assembly protein LptE/RlpB
MTQMTRAQKAIAALLAAGTLLAGCGYHLVGQASNIPEDIEKIFVEPLENSTPRAQVEQILTRAISDELLTRRRYEIVNTAEEAHAVLRGNVISFNVRPVTFDPDGLADSFEISISADMKFQRTPSGTDEGEVIWANSRYVFRQDYRLEEDETAYFDRENIAIESTSEEFAKTLVTDLLEGF